MPQKPPPPKRNGASSSNKISDPRFASFETDPRFRLPSRRHTKTTLDARFSRILRGDSEFAASTKVDRYGRRLKSDVKAKALRQLYRAEDEDEDDADDDEEVQRELRAANKKYDPARGGGFSSSDEFEEESDSEGVEEDSEDGAELDAGTDMQRFREEQTGVETGEVTRRIAVVNLDWDHIKSIDLMALFNSFIPVGGRIERVSIYPSEFGKERTQREELEGPPKEIFKKGAAENDESGASEESDSDDDDFEDDSDDEIKKDLIKEGDDQDFDSDALRSYQLDRLRYYYAVVACSDKSTAHKVYEATDGSEYLSSSNFLDLRFVPDDVTFDEEPRDECESVPVGYKPIEFVTDALQHSKVKLTWDMHPEEATRKESIKKAFTGSRADIAENDLHAYLASDSDDEGQEDEPVAQEEATDEPRLTKKELARRRMREALGLSNEPALKSSKAAPVGDMEITFTPALTGKDSSKKKISEEEETTIEKYMRKERERKDKKREQAIARRGGITSGAIESGRKEKSGDEDLGFDDPFFTSEAPEAASKTATHKEERRKKREVRDAKAAESAAQKAQLELLMADNTNEGASHLDHFDMAEIMRAEKQKSKKAKGKKKGKTKEREDRDGLQEDFSIDIQDSRFKAVFEDHEFAIDPSNPKFKPTQAMKKLLEEGRKRKYADGHSRDGTVAERLVKKSKAAT